MDQIISESTKKRRFMGTSDVIRAAESKPNIFNQNTGGAAVTVVVLQTPFAPKSAKAPLAMTCFITGEKNDPSRSAKNSVLQYSIPEGEKEGHITCDVPFGEIHQIALFNKNITANQVGFCTVIDFTGVKYSIRSLGKALTETITDIDGSSKSEIVIQMVGTPFMNFTASSAKIRAVTSEQLAQLLSTYTPTPLTDMPIVQRYIHRKAIALGEVKDLPPLYPEDVRFIGDVPDGKSVPLNILMCDGWHTANAIIAIDNRLFGCDPEQIPEERINARGPLTCIADTDRDPNVYVHELKDEKGHIPCLGFSKKSKHWTLFSLPKEGRPTALYGGICFQTAISSLCSNVKVWPLIGPQIARNLVGYMAIELKLTSSKDNADKAPAIVDCLEIIQLIQSQATDDHPAPDIIISGMATIKALAWETFIGAGVMIGRDHFKEYLTKLNVREKNNVSIPHFIDSGDAAVSSPLYQMISKDKRVPESVTIFPLFEFTGDIDHYFPENRWAIIMVPIDSLYAKYAGKEIYKEQNFPEMNTTQTDKERYDFMMDRGWLTGASPSAYAYAVARQQT